MVIRKLRKEDDFTGLIVLSRFFFEEYTAFHTEFFNIDVLRDEDIIGYFRGTVETDDGATFIATEDGMIVGYITVFLRNQESFWAIKRIGAISGLMVHKDYRSRGIASGLLAEAKAFFEEREVKYFTVYTATANEAAIELYEHRGMTPLYATLIGEI